MTVAPDPDPDEVLEIAIDANFNRVLRSSSRPERQIIVGPEAWAAFVASIRAGQTF
ncbi:hypothetical protein ACIA47_23600 [Micromonospora sp. NPDC051227]|uniref:hypothetical protein n=1 Tax=Micromonospora sp. NPDC051227 TaxID=3364285 RepID=UPI0037967F3B